MNIPLTWLAEYVKLPKTDIELTDKLTMIGHMLDKRLTTGEEVIIDLELRGNRSDLFGLVGIAREVSAAYNKPLVSLETKALPKTDIKSKLVTVAATDLVERFMGFTLSVTVGPSPAWLTKRLELYGIASINNVVDITNYVMLETGEPMHAYDMDKLTGNKLIVRRARKGERMVTLQGTTITFTSDDLVIADEKKPQGTAIIGSRDSGVTDTTAEILLEAAVYNQANVRRTARRLGVRTEAGNRHEKLLDPNQVPIALARAYFLLHKLAAAKPVGAAADIYLKKRKHVPITVPLADVKRLTGADVPVTEITGYLKRLGFEVTKDAHTLRVVTPTQRTDIEESADVVEEIIRLHGYNTIPVRTLSGQLPEPNTYTHIALYEQLQDILVRLHCNEVITSPIIDNELIELYQQEGQFARPITLTNAPDPAKATLRPTLLPNLVSYAKRSLGFRQQRIAFFEIGKIYQKSEDPPYRELPALALIMGGATTTNSWGNNAKTVTVYDLKGTLEQMCEELGFQIKIVTDAKHPSMTNGLQASLVTPDGTYVGSLGALHPAIAQHLKIPMELFVAELSLDIILNAPKTQPQPYRIAPPYPPVMEDITFIVPNAVATGELIDTIKKLDPLIADSSLIAVYKDTRTLRITYADPTKTLTRVDVEPIKQKILNTAHASFGAKLKI